MESGAGRTESIECLYWLRWRVGKSNATMYLVQVVDEPQQATALNVQKHILVPVKHVAELIVKVGGRPVEGLELLQDRDGREIPRWRKRNGECHWSRVIWGR